MSGEARLEEGQLLEEGVASALPWGLSGAGRYAGAPDGEGGRGWD